MPRKLLASVAIIGWVLLIIASYFSYGHNTHQANLSLNIGKVGHISPKRNSLYDQLEYVPDLVAFLKIKYSTRSDADPRLVETYSDNLHHVFGSILNIRVEGSDPILVRDLATEIRQWVLLRHERLYKEKLASITIYNPVDLNGIIYHANNSTDSNTIKSRQNQELSVPILPNVSYSTNNWLLDRYLLSPVNSRPTEIIHDISVKIKYDPRKLLPPLGTLSLAFLPIIVYLYRQFRRIRVL